ncbi:MAG: hypothetical protein DYG98_00445 [Haliscomenobacteraceae bacterium CHB4]|nr:hypothetical protein [Saprospiraceae bacterium]MCE7921505.1 hypothetical protein [Haliscomenobacteraceae bacterium CHB4]
MKRIIWFIALLLLFFMGDRLAGHFLQKLVEQSQFRYSRLYRGDAAAEILLVGNSRGLNFFQPYMEEITGKKTFNLSYNGMPTDLAKVLVEDYLDRYPTPEKMVVDITNCDRMNDELLAGFLTYSAESFRLDTLINSKLPKIWWGGKISAMFRFNNEIFQRALYHRNRTDENWLRDHVISAKLAAEGSDKPYPLEIHPYLVRQLKETVITARAKGVGVELVIGPYFPGYRVNNLDVLKNAVEEATGLPVRDYQQVLTDPTCFSDFRHLNVKGSKAFIERMKSDGVLGN